MKRFEIVFGLLKIPTDFLMTIAAFLVSYRLRLLFEFERFPLDLGRYLSSNEYLMLSLKGAGLFLVILMLHRLYTMKATATLGWELRRITVASLIWLMVVISYYFIIRDFPFSRLVLGYSLVLIIVFVSFGRVLIRIFQRILLNKGIGKRRIALIGDSKINNKILKFLSSLGVYEIVGVISEKSILQELKYLGPLSDIEKIIKEYRLDELLQTGAINKEISKYIIALSREYHLIYSFVPDVLSMARSRIEIFNLTNIPVITLKLTSLDGWGRVFKRAFDVFGSAILLVLLSPFLLIVAIIIKLDSPGTVFFRYLDDGTLSKRVGQKGKLFHLWKFRTMRMKTHNLRYTELAFKNSRKGTPLVKIQDDPRITRFGRFLRKFSLDELPNLWNVLKGEMSLVGPRPHLPEEVEKYQKHHKFVLTLKPGVTGLAQISGRSDLYFEEEVRLDTYYIENWSPLLDLKVLFKTVLVVLKGYRE